MRSSPRLRPIGSGLLVLCGLAAPGRADVTATGDFATSFSIEVPSFRGLAPSLQLSYSANAGNGVVGVGWRLDGTSAIVRTGSHGGVPLGPPGGSDRFMLDGEELIPCAAGSPSPSCTTGIHLRGSSDGFYSTRRESFQRLEHRGGVTPWTLWLTDGRTGRYETYDGGLSWLLTATADRHGNAIDYRYTCTPGLECELDSIRYGDHGTARGAEIHFFYMARPDATERASGSGFSIGARRLRSITVEVGGALARAYALDYTTSAASGRSILASIQQFPRDAVVDRTSDPGRITAGPTPPLPPTTYATASQSTGTGWQFGTLPGAGLLSIADLPSGAVPRHYQRTELAKLAGFYYDANQDTEVPLPSQQLVGDFDGDGRAELVVGYVESKCMTVGINGLVTRKAGFAAIPGRLTTKLPSRGFTDCVPSFWIADVDGDHRDDVLYAFHGQLYAASLGSSSFRPLARSQPWTVKPDSCAIADVDGDSRDDLVCLSDASGAVQLVTARSRGDGSFDVTYASPGVALADPMAAADINGDGLDDVAFAAARGGSRQLVVLVSRGDGTYGTEVQATSWAVGSRDRLRAGDLDGDGLGDLLLTHAGTGGAGGLALSVEGVGLGRFEVRALASAWANPLLGDVDGDGKADLIDPVGLTAAIGDGQGGFSAPVTAFPISQCGRPYITDTDGDGRTDLLCVDDDAFDPTLPLVVNDYSSTRPLRDPHRWMSGDVDGDGQRDYVYVHARNPGLSVLSVLTTGTPRRAVWSAGPTAALPGLDDSSATHWILADVGGPLGRADGKDDLVMVDTDGTTLRVYSLIGKGDGSYAPAVDAPWRDASGATRAYAGSDLGNFFPLDSDGDGDTDLVHLARGGFGGVVVELLRSGGDGKWTSSATSYFAGSAPAIAAVTDFRPMEVNGDGLIDLVNVQSGGGMTGTVIRSLISRGDGTFTEVADAQSASWIDVARWQPVDLNGDGMTDLLHVRSSTVGYASLLHFDQLVARGDGTYQPRSNASAALAINDPELTRALESTSSIYPADLNGDGFTDLLHISRYRDAGGGRHTLLVRVVNPGVVSGLPTWSIPPPVKVGSAVVPAGAPWGWRAYRDVARPNSPGFALIDPAGAVTAVYDLPSDRLTHVDNGNGGTTDVEYTALLGARDYLPSGFVPVVTAAVTRADQAYVPALAERTTYGYAGARWSDARQRLLGFAYVAARGAALMATTQYATDEACAGSTLQVISADAQTAAVLAYTSNTRVAPGTGPYTCMVQQQAQYACEGSGSCRLEDELQVTYDAYGNVVQSTERVADGPTRKVFTPVYANQDAYVVGLPAYRAVYQDDGAPVLMSQDLYEYDGNLSYLAAAGPRGEIQRIRRWDSTAGQYVTSELVYDPTGLLLRATDPEGGWTETKYDATYHAFPVSLCDRIGCTKTAWDTVIGKIKSSTDANGATTRFGFDAHGRVSEIKYPDGGVTRTEVLGLGRVTGPLAQRQRTRTEVADGSAGDGVAWTEQYLDGWGRTYRIDHEGGSSQLTEYGDLSRRPARVSETFATGSSPQRFTTSTYDAIGRLIAQVEPDGASRRWRFDVGSIEVTDELGKVRTIAHDGLGEVVRVTETIGASTHDTVYGYDAAHRLIGSMDPLGLPTSYYYDTLGRRIAESDPDRGLREYTYRADGGMLTSQDAKGQRIEYSYDATGRPVQRDDRDAGGAIVRTVQWTYDELPGLGPQGASLGHVVEILDEQPQAKLSTRLAYDVMGRVSEDVRCVDGTCYGMRHAFDVAGRLSRLTYPDPRGGFGAGAETVDHVYDEAGRLIQVGPYVTSIKYAVDGLPTLLRYGNGVATDYDYDPDRRWTTSVKIRGASQVYEAGYVHDASGRITELTEASPTNQDTMQLTYDDLGRLTRVRTTDPRLDRDLAYDAIGRITYYSPLGDYHYDDPAHPHAMTSADRGARRRYDANGDTVAMVDPGGRALKLEWTVDDRPAMIDSSLGTYQLAYDAAGRRVKKEGPGDHAMYFGDHVAVENGTLIKYYFAGGRLVARNDGKVAYYHQDHTRSVRVETDQAGNVANAYQYDVTGVPVVEHEAFDDNLGFAGVHGDQALGLTYLGARYYDPTSARFLSADSVVRDVYAPQSLDRYAYVENDPVNHWDPSGHMRRDIELMKERKQMWRSLMVAWEAGLNFCGSAPEFCQAGISHTVVVWGKDGSVQAVITPDMDPAVARWQWDQAFAAPAPGATAQSAGEGAAKLGGGGSAGSGGGGGGGVAGTLLKTVMAADPRLPVAKELQVPIGGSKAETATITDGPLAGTSVTATVKVDKDGKIDTFGITVDSDAKVVVTSAAPVGDYVTVQIVSDGGDHTLVTKNGADGKSGTESENKIQGGAKATADGSGEQKTGFGEWLTETFGIKLGGSVGIDGSHTGKQSSEATVTASKESMSRSTMSQPRSFQFHVVVEGSPAAAPLPRLQGVVEVYENGVLIQRKEIR